MGRKSLINYKPEVMPSYELLDCVDNAQRCSAQSPWHSSCSHGVQRRRIYKSGSKNNMFIRIRTIRISYIGQVIKSSY